MDTWPDPATRWVTNRSRLFEKQACSKCVSLYMPHRNRSISQHFLSLRCVVWIAVYLSSSLCGVCFPAIFLQLDTHTQITYIYIFFFLFLFTLSCVLSLSVCCLELQRLELSRPRRTPLWRDLVPAHIGQRLHFFASTCNINHAPGGIAGFASGCHKRSCLLYTCQREPE